MAKPAARIAVVQFCLGLGVLAVLARAAQLQLVQGGAWAAEAAAQRTATEVLPARRGTIYDRNGVPLAVTQEFYHVGIAPNEVTDRRTLVRAAARGLGLPAGAVETALRRKKYVYYHGPYTATQVQPLRGLAGVHLEGDFLRFYPSRDLARPIIGRLSVDRLAGGSGLELSLDSMLTGTPGERVVLKDHRGRRYDSPSRLVRDPVPGHDVVLTIDAELQEIAERGLDDAIAEMNADGGDVVFLEPTTGELLALASRQKTSQDIGSARASTFTDTYQPGSTAKLFTAAALLARRKVDSTDAVSGEGGAWELQITTSGRTWRIEDDHREDGMLTLAHAIQVSSNIAMAKFAQRLTPEEHFEVLRDFGFGSPTGAEYPSEARGQLRMPNRWDALSRASIAMGYELAVTPVQLAAAYAAIANDGVLLTPTLVREVRGSDGTVLYTHQPEPVRRAVSPEVAARLREFLHGAIGEGGTGRRAQLQNFSLIGKTGTARRVIDGRYRPGEYTASFAALFPADDPQLVVIVKLDSPKRGGYYGGLTAAPVTRTMLQQALASHRVAIDRSRLAPRLDTTAAAAPPAPLRAGAGATTTVVAWPGGLPADSAATDRAVPDVVGGSARGAVLALHRRGFRVALRGLGTVARTDPEPGSSAPAGSTVTVWTNE